MFVIEEMHGSDRIPDLKLIASEPGLDRHCSTRAKWRALLSADHAGLLVKGKLVLKTEKAPQSYELMKAKALRGMSIGYDTIRSSMKDGARQLHEVKLYEVSMTPFPANDQAQVTAVKDSRDAVAQFCRVMAQYTKQIRGRGV